MKVFDYDLNNFLLDLVNNFIPGIRNEFAVTLKQPNSQLIVALLLRYEWVEFGV
jgi:hypothetical protein